MMIKRLSAFLLMIISGTFFAQNSPLKVSDIEAVFGKGFTEEKALKIGQSESYRFKSKDFTVVIKIDPAYGVKKVNEYINNKMIKWQAAPNDPDGAMVEIRDDKTDDLASTPAVAYIRKDKFVYLSILGNYYSDLKKMPEEREKMRKKLLQLKRIP